MVRTLEPMILEMIRLYIRVQVLDQRNPSTWSKSQAQHSDLLCGLSYQFPGHTRNHLQIGQIQKYVKFLSCPIQSIRVLGVSYCPKINLEMNLLDQEIDIVLSSCVGVNIFFMLSLKKYFYFHVIFCQFGNLTQ